MYHTGEVPNDWWTTNVINLPERSEEPNLQLPTDPSCKLTEHIITSSIMRHTNTYNILYQLQHRFCSMRSCKIQLLTFVADIANTTQKGAQTDILIMDFSKAFDKVSQTKLVQRFHYYSIQDKTNKIIESFIANRKQTVVLEDGRSDEANVISGIHQGFILGSCPFLFYINDIPKSIPSRVRLFADDAVMYLTIRSTTE